MNRGFVARQKEGMKKGNGRESKWDLKQEIDGHAEGQGRHKGPGEKKFLY